MLSQKMRRRSLLVGYLILVAACSIVVIACSSPTARLAATPSVAASEPSTPQLASTQENKASPTLSATSSPLVSPTSTALVRVTPLSQLRPTYVALSSTPVHQLLLEKQNAAWILLDDYYIYWATYQDPRHILRYPLTEGKTETVVTSQYPDGDLISLRPIRNKDWLIFLDTPQSAGYTTWTVRALNLRTQKEQVVVEEPGDPVSWPGPDLSADGDWVVWTRTGHGKTATCDETMLMMRNLTTGEVRELDRACTQNTYKWAVPSLVGDRLIVERDLPDSRGRGNEVYLFDLTSGQRQSLTGNEQGSMPKSSLGWAAWKHGSRYKEGTSNTVYNLHTGERHYVIVPDQAMNGDPQLFDHWLYWQPEPLQPFYVFDLENGYALTVTVPSNNEAIYPVAVGNNTVAWQRDLDFENAPPKDSVLEWRTLQ